MPYDIRKTKQTDFTTDESSFFDQTYLLSHSIGKHSDLLSKYYHVQSGQ